MNDALQRAAALRELLELGRYGEAVQPVAEAIVRCGEDLIDAGEPRLALGLIDSAAGLLDSVTLEYKLRLGILRARALQVARANEESLDLIRIIKQEFRDLLGAGSKEACALHTCEATNLWQLNRADEAVEKLMAVRSELLSMPDSRLLAQCTLALSSAEIVRGEIRQARAFALEAIVSARRSSSEFVEGIALLNLSLLERMYCRWASAEEASSEALALFKRGGNRVQINHTKRVLGIIAWKRGHLEKALEFAEDSLREATELGYGVPQWLASLLNGMILVHAGDAGEARNIFTSRAGWDAPRADSRPSLLTTEFLGDIHLEQGQAAEALRYYDEVWPKALALVPKGDIVAELRRRRAEAYYLLGRFDDAYAEALTGLEHCRELGDRYEEAATYRVLAISAAAIGKAAEAKRWFDQGFAYYDDIETPYEWGKLWLAYGDWLRGPHAAEYVDERAAQEAYQAAHDHFERMGAQAKLREVRTRMAALVAREDATLARDRERVTGTEEQPRRPQRRPRGWAELERRGQWARENFGLVTRSQPMLQLLEEVAKLAPSDTPILVLGESGTGKELVAHGLHRLSGRKGTFFAVNSSALPREMIESELFGHVAGSFSGAIRDRVGIVEVCTGGTVFLDEIAEMSVELQTRLLRFLETGESRRVGSSKNVAVDTRVVAATNRDRGLLEKGEGFRADLYYRLAHAVVELPPLRRRGEDVELLIGHFLAESCAEHDKHVKLSRGVLERLKNYSWPGNVRQLKSVIKRAVLLSATGHEVSERELVLSEERVPTTLQDELEHAERRRIAEALAQTRGSRTEAAKALGIPRTTLISKLRRYGLG